MFGLLFDNCSAKDVLALPYLTRTKGSHRIGFQENSFAFMSSRQLIKCFFLNPSAEPLQAHTSLAFYYRNQTSLCYRFAAQPASSVQARLPSVLVGTGFNRLFWYFDQTIPFGQAIPLLPNMYSIGNHVPSWAVNTCYLSEVTQQEDISISDWDGQLKSVKGCWSNIELLLHVLSIVVCFNSRRLTICKHGLFTANRWVKHPWNMPDTRMFTNSKVSAMEADNNSQLAQ